MVQHCEIKHTLWQNFVAYLPAVYVYYIFYLCATICLVNKIKYIVTISQLHNLLFYQMALNQYATQEFQCVFIALVKIQLKLTPMSKYK